MPAVTSRVVTRLYRAAPTVQVGAVLMWNADCAMKCR
jgi:hypothetical protein